MTTKPAKPRKNRAPLNRAMGLLGLVALIALTTLTQFEAPNGTSALLALVLIGSLAVMFFTRNSDEYTAELWRSGANAAFITIAAWTLLGPFAMGAIEGYNAAHEGHEPDEPAFDRLYAASSTIALYAIYLTFNIKRLTGAL